MSENPLHTQIPQIHNAPIVQAHLKCKVLQVFQQLPEAAEQLHPMKLQSANIPVLPLEHYACAVGSIPLVYVCGYLFIGKHILAANAAVLADN